MLKREKFLALSEKYAFSNLSFLVNALIVLLAWHFKLTAAGIIILGLISVFYSLTQKTMAPSLAPVAFFIFSISAGYSFNNAATNVLTFSGLALIVISFAIFIIKNKVKIRLSPNFWGFCALGLSFAIGGLFSGYNYSAKQTLFVILSAIALPAVYILLSSAVKGDSKKILAKLFMSLGIIVSTQMLIRILIADDPNYILTNKLMDLGWGITNSAAKIFMLSIPFTLYLAADTKHPYFYLFAAFMQCAFLALTFSRGCILIFLVAVIPMFIYLFIKSKNRKAVITISCILSILLIIVIILLFEYVFKDFMNIWSLGFDDRGRFELYNEALELFRKNPLFGTGILYRFGEIYPSFHYFHNTFLQAMASAGIFGLAGMCFHKIAQYRPFLSRRLFKDKDTFKMFAFLALLLSEAYGFIDVTYFTNHYLALICVIMAVSDNLPVKEKSEITKDITHKKTLFEFNTNKLIIASVITLVTAFGIMTGIMYSCKIPLFFKPYHILTAFAAIILLYPLSKLLLAIGYIVFARLTPQQIKFGFKLKLGGLYCRNKKPLPASQTLLPLLMPLFFTGILPAVCAVITGNMLLMLAAAILIAASCGDVAAVFSLFKQKDNLVEFHPDYPAYYIYTGENKSTSGLISLS